MTDLSFLEKLPLSLQLLLGLPIAYATYFLFAKGLRDKLFLPAPTYDSREELRQRWEGPVNKHLELMGTISESIQVLAETMGALREINKRLDAYDVRIRECERNYDRLPRRR